MIKPQAEPRSAKILAFTPRRVAVMGLGHEGVGGCRLSRLDAVAPIQSGSSWYHEAAVREADRSRRS